MTVVVSTAKCICSPYSAYIGVGNVVPTMMAAKAYASMPKARRVFVLVLGTLNNSDPGWGLIPPREPGNAHRSVRGDGLLGPDAGERPHLELGIDLRVTAVRRRQSADDAEDEGQRNRHNARIGQREPGEVHVRKDLLRPPRHRGGEDEQKDRRDQSAVKTPPRAAGVEPRTVQRVQDRGQVRRGRNREGERDQERAVLPAGEDA